MEEGHEGLTQFLMNEVVKLQQQSKVKTLQQAELSRQNCTLEDEHKKLRLANQELQAFQQSTVLFLFFNFFLIHVSCFNCQAAKPNLKPARPVCCSVCIVGCHLALDTKVVKLGRDLLIGLGKTLWPTTF